MRRENGFRSFKPKRFVVMLLLSVLLTSVWIPVVPTVARAEAGSGGGGGGGAVAGGSSGGGVQAGNAIGYNLSRWILDEPNGYIYTVSTDANKLLFIRTSDLQVEKEIDIGSKPSDLDMDNGKLYVAISGGTLIKVVDLAQKAVEKEIATTLSPSRLIAVGDKLYYAPVNYTWSVYEVRLTTGQNTFVTGMSHYNAAFAADKTNGILYVGDHGSSGSDAKAYRISDNAPLHGTTYDDGYGFSYPDRELIYRGGDLFYAGYKLDGSNLGMLHGKFVEPGTSSTAKLKAVTDRYVLSEQTIFDRKTFTAIASHPLPGDLLLMSSTNDIFGFDGVTKKVLKVSPDLSQPAAPITYTKPIGDSIVFNKALTAWAPSPNGDYVYAISKEANRLLYIRTSDWVVEKDIHIGSQPTDLSVVNGQVYVALNGATSIAVVNTVYGTAVTDSVYSMPVRSNPIRIDGSGDQLFYTDSGIRVVNAVYADGKRLRELNNQLYWHSYDDVLAVPASGVLYADISNGIVSINASSYAILNQTSNLNYSSSKLIYDGAYLYRGNQRLSASVVSTVYGTYGSGGSGGNIVYAKGNYVFAENALYDRDSFNKIANLPDMVAAAYMDDAGRVYLYMPLLNKAVKYDSIQSLIAQNPANQPPVHTVQNLQFKDTDTMEGKIGGWLSWTQPVNSQYITGYVVYFLNGQMNKVGEAIGVAEKYYTSFSIPGGTAVPDGVSYLGVYSKNEYGESAAAATVKLIDLASPGPSDVFVYGMSVQDLDSRRGFIDATYHWVPDTYSGAPHADTIMVQLYFVDNGLTPLGDIVKEARFGDASLPQKTALGEVPADAKYVMVKYKHADGTYDSLVNLVPLIDNISSEPVSADVGGAGAPSEYTMNMNFADSDYDAGRLGGQFFHSYFGPDTVTEFVLYFLDKDGQRLRPLMEFTRQQVFDPRISHAYMLETGTVIPDGAMMLGLFPKNRYGEGTLGAVRAIWDAPFAQPSQVRFTDANPLRGISGAKLTWAPNMEEKSPLREYAVFYLDKYAMPIGEPAAIVPSGQERYEVFIPDDSIPSDAVSIVVNMKDSLGELLPVGTTLMQTTPISDNISGELQFQYPYDPAMVTPNAWGIGPIDDEDGDAGEIGATFIWSYGSNNQFRYNLYFMDAQANKIKPIVSVKEHLMLIPSAQIPLNTAVPEGAKEIGIFVWDGQKEGGRIGVPIVDNTYSPSLAADQIQVVNNEQGTNDTVTVTGLMPGDRIKLYRSNTIAYPMLEKVSEGTSVSFSIPQLGKEAGSIYVTTKADSYLESRRVTKAYSAEPTTGNPGTGGPGPVGGGCCAGAGGSSAPQTEAPGTYAPTTRTETSGGKTYNVAELDAAKLADAFKQAKQQEKNGIVVDLKDAPNAKVQIPAEALLSAAESSSGVNVVSIKSGNVTYELPLALFDVQAIATQLGIETKDVFITVTMEQVSGAAAEQIESRAQRDGVTLLATPVEFTIIVGSGDKQQRMSDFGGTYVARTFVLTQAADGSRTTAVRIDPVTGELHFVPASFETADGQTAVRMLRQGNSVYTVVETKPKSFADLQGHWAKADIELLAAKLIVKGATEDGFMPDQSITRAEFAALLVRSLGIAEERMGRSSFEDVPADAWFAGSIAAASSKGLVEGIDEKRFGPNEPITREQMALMIARALSLIGKQDDKAGQADALNRFADRSSVSTWAQAAVSRAVHAGLMNGVVDDRFEPAERASRAQVAVMLKRMLQYVGFMN